jgi:hypothetical protein
MAANRQLYGLEKPKRQPRAKLEMPFRASRRHEYWSADIRYIEEHLLPDPKPVYVITIFENFSRMVLSSAISATQNQWDYLAVLADARTWPEIQQAHQTWRTNYNIERHYAHRERQDGRHSPSEVLRGVLGRTYPEEVLSRALYATQFTRHLDRHRYLNFKHWRFLGKMGWPEKRFPCGSMRALPPKPGFHGKNVVTPMFEDEQNAPVFRGMTAQRPTGACPGTRPGSCPR